MTHTNNLTPESLRHAVLGMRKDSCNARTASVALTLGMSAHPDDAEAALDHARRLLAPLSTTLLDYVREVEERASSWSEDMLDARLCSVAEYRPSRMRVRLAS